MEKGLACGGAIGRAVGFEIVLLAEVEQNLDEHASTCDLVETNSEAESNEEQLETLVAAERSINAMNQGFSQ